jgi:N-hydroxyarylamine O-acetyltransferase
MAAHQLAVPFSSLAMHTQDGLDPTNIQATFERIVARRMGGMCYEINSLFAALLEALGCGPVEMLGTRVAGPGGYFSAPFIHSALRVRCDGNTRLVDVGFGRCEHGPIDLGARGEQEDRFGTFVVVPVEGGAGDVDLVRNGVPL